MNIRVFEPSDLGELKRIHEAHYASEFSLPDFVTKYLCAFTVEDETGIVSIGGVRTLTESVVVTDKDRSTRDRRDALYHILDASVFVNRASGYDQLHAFVQDPKWAEQLIRRAGFKVAKGQALVLCL